MQKLSYPASQFSDSPNLRSRRDWKTSAHRHLPRVAKGSKNNGNENLAICDEFRRRFRSTIGPEAAPPSHPQPPPAIQIQKFAYFFGQGFSKMVMACCVRVDSTFIFILFSLILPYLLLFHILLFNVMFMFLRWYSGLHLISTLSHNVLSYYILSYLPFHFYIVLSYLTLSYVISCYLISC